MDNKSIQPKNNLKTATEYIMSHGIEQTSLHEWLGFSLFHCVFMTENHFKNI